MAKDHPTGESGLYSALLELKTPEECYRFLQDVCSYSELSAMEQRYNIAEMLVDKRIYTEIMDKTGASSAIISRVSLFTYLGAALLIFCYYRTFSRNISKRTEENYKFYTLKDRVDNKFKGWKEQWANRKVYHYYRCPQCRQKLRVPRGRGRIQISCPRCGTQFIKKS